MIVLKANVSITRFPHWTALTTILPNQHILLHLSLCAIAETLIMVVRLIRGQYCAIHDRLCWSNLTTMLRHVVLCSCASGRLE